MMFFFVFFVFLRSTTNNAHSFQILLSARVGRRRSYVKNVPLAKAKVAARTAGTEKATTTKKKIVREQCYLGG
jgi:hypothetical protein